METDRLYITRVPSYTKKEKILAAFNDFEPTHAVVLIRPTGNVSYVTFKTKELAQAALEYAQTHPIKIRNKTLKVLSADSWHYRPQPGPTSKSLPKVNPFPGYEPRYAPDLPLTALVKISEYLPFKERAKMEMVCHQWRAGSREAMKTINQLTVEDWRWYNEWNVSCLNKRSFHWVITRCGAYLQDLRIPHNVSLQPQNITIAVKCSPNLVIFDARGVTLRPNALAALADGNNLLQVLLLGKTEGPSTPFLGKIFSSNALLDLRMKWTNLAGNSLGHLPTTLETLVLDYNEVDLPMLRIGLSKLDRLQSLTIISPSDFDQSIIDILKTNENLGKNITILELVSCNPESQYEPVPAGEEEATNGRFPFYEYDKGPVEAGKTLPECYPEVMQLNVSYNGWINVDFIREMGQHMLKITQLNITGCSNIRGLYALDSLSLLISLEHLEMSYLHISVGGYFLRLMTTLETIICRESGGICGEDISGLIEGCPAIREIDVEGCLGVHRGVVNTIQEYLPWNPKEHQLSIYLGGTSAYLVPEDRPVQNVCVYYTRLTESPFNL